MKPTILLPELPDTTDPKAVKDYLAAHQKILADKQKDDYETVTNNKNERYPVGTWYTQYPSVKSNDEAVAFPESEEPANKFGGVWTDMYTGEGVVFQTAETVDHYTRTNGLMEGHIEDHAHYAYIWRSNSTGSGYWCLITRNGADGQGAFATGVPVSGNHGSKTAHRNRVMKVWYRES